MAARKRIYSQEEACRARLKAQKPLLPCTAKNKEEWQAWRRAFKRAIVKELGPDPESVPLRPEILERTDMGGYIREKVVFDSDPYNSVPAWVLTPKDLKPKQQVPGILVAHGHGHGKNTALDLDAEGNYETGRLPTGVYSLRASATDYATAMRCRSTCPKRARRLTRR